VSVDRILLVVAAVYLVAEVILRGRIADGAGRLIQRWFSPVWQLRLGVWMIVAAVVLHARGQSWFPNEPPGVLQLSVSALTLTGIGFISTARLSAVTEDTSEDVDTHREVTEP
jgi:drug/metabolite transporter (DMT)-like permease